MSEANMISLVPLPQTELDSYLQDSIREYADDHVRTGNWKPEEALERSKREFDELLPQGVNSPGQHLFSIRERATELPVGMIWFAERGQGQTPFAFIYDLIILPEHRGKGYGEAAMRAVEDEARKLGLKRISLHVFGQNRVARNLYEKLGYEPTNIQMSKDLD